MHARAAKARITLVVLGAASATLLAVAIAWWAQRGPTHPAAATFSPAPKSQAAARTRENVGRLPLRGVLLRGDSGLRLLVADTPAPFVLDADRRTREPITGLPTRGERGTSVLAVGEDALVLSTGFCGRCQYGPYFVCKDGPIFPYDKLALLFGREGF